MANSEAEERIGRLADLKNAHPELEGGLSAREAQRPEFCPQKLCRNPRCVEVHAIQHQGARDRQVSGTL